MPAAGRQSRHPTRATPQAPDTRHEPGTIPSMHMYAAVCIVKAKPPAPSILDFLLQQFPTSRGGLLLSVPGSREQFTDIEVRTPKLPECLTVRLTVGVMSTQAYLEVVGSGVQFPAAYAGCISRRCARCGQPEWVACINPLTRAEAHAPCLARLRHG